MIYGEILELVRKLRKNQTTAEKILWSELKNRKLDGVKFLRQHPTTGKRDKNNTILQLAIFFENRIKLSLQ
ncbi:MAG: DUF559 domain-containing protein [Bacteroidetes bacterium]|nr:DUF559 domain-containing protein [Bacteroidota bacterium]